MKLYFGALAENISEQLDEQKLKYEKAIIKRFQRNSEEIIDLRFSSILTDSEVKKCERKLFSQIQKHIMKHNNNHD